MLTIRKYKILVLLALLSVTLSGVLYLTINRPVVINGEKYQKLKEYQYVEPGSLTCDAFMPECGYCPGIQRNKECYVKE